MAATLEGVNASQAVDLADPQLTTQIAQQRAAAEIKAKAIVQLARLDQRISHLQRKHARLPISNGKRKIAIAIKEATALRQTLTEAIR